MKIAVQLLSTGSHKWDHHGDPGNPGDPHGDPGDPLVSPGSFDHFVEQKLSKCSPRLLHQTLLRGDHLVEQKLSKCSPRLAHRTLPRGDHLVEQKLSK